MYRDDKRLNYLRIIIHREEWTRCKNLLAKLGMPLLGKYNPFEDVFSPLVKQPVEEVEILPRQGYAFPSNPKLRKRWTKVKGVTLDEFEQMFCSKESAITNKESELQIALAAKAKLESDIVRIRRELWELLKHENMKTIRDFYKDKISVTIRNKKDWSRFLKLASQKHWHWLAGQSAYGFKIEDSDLQAKNRVEWIPLNGKIGFRLAHGIRTKGMSLDTFIEYTHMSPDKRVSEEKKL